MAPLQFPPRHLRGLEAQYLKTLRRIKPEKFEMGCPVCQLRLWAAATLLTGEIVWRDLAWIGEQALEALRPIGDLLDEINEQLARDPRTPKIRRML